MKEKERERGRERERERDVTSKDYFFTLALALNKEVTVMVKMSEKNKVSRQPFQVPWHFGPSSGIKSKSALTGQAGEDGHTCLVVDTTW